MAHFFDLTMVIKYLKTTFLVMSIMTLSLHRIVAEVTQNEEGTEGVISFTPPSLNDEEAHSSHMPEMFKCDACTAIAYQLSESFAAAHSKRKSVQELPESEVYRLVEEICGGDEMTKYGVKEVKGKKRLSGPGLPTADSPGIMQGGGRWPDRMNRMCNLYVETYDEEGIYHAWLKDREQLKKFLCHSDTQSGLTDVCSPVKRKKRPSRAKRDEF